MLLLWLRYFLFLFFFCGFISYFFLFCLNGDPKTPFFSFMIFELLCSLILYHVLNVCVDVIVHVHACVFVLCIYLSSGLAVV